MKHIVLVSAVVVGSIMWVRLGKLAKTTLAQASEQAS
jgi:hypothetical protein